MVTMNLALIIEVVSGIAALLLTAMAFTHLVWSEGAAAQTMQRQSWARAKRLFWLAGILWTICVGSYLFMRFQPAPGPGFGAGTTQPGAQGGYPE